MPLKELEKDRAAIESKRQSASPTLSAEYDKNIAEIDAQLKAHKSLLERKESLEIKLHSLSNQFRQLSLDLASAHAVDAQSKLGERHAALEKLSKKAEEIRLTIEDMHTGSDDWLSAEIEKLSRNRVSQDGA
jgi:cell division protein FtsB